MKDKKKTKLDDWFNDHVVTMGSDDVVIKVEEKIKNHLINGTQFENNNNTRNRGQNEKNKKMVGGWCGIGLYLCHIPDEG